ncbi:hypothetical protein TSUD_357310 [Trifolium subterraneum]|uniref:Uncharacterized protein n=1 Tax=Trifolium subterraneum TaxID=3900 RepID=A0A2Z6NAW3_TRISU|nr:hypothetical protein TSUD_357310 [Trifolium subterraneum]
MANERVGQWCSQSNKIDMEKRWREREGGRERVNLGRSDPNLEVRLINRYDWMFGLTSTMGSMETVYCFDGDRGSKNQL